MAEIYGFFNSSGGDRVYQASFWRSLVASFVSNGLLQGYLNELEVTAGNPDVDMTIAIDTGASYINGTFHAVETTALGKTLNTQGAGNDRIDRIVVRWDLTSRTMTVEILEGTPAVTPSAPALTQTSSLWEYSLAQIYITGGQLFISASDITDERFTANFPAVISNIDGSKANAADLGDISTLITTDKTSAVNAINEIDSNLDLKRNIALQDISNQDLNTFVTNGDYFGNNLSNAPTTGYYVLEVFDIGSGYTLQKVTQVAGTVTPKSYYRIQDGAGTWRAWQEFYHTGNDSNLAKLNEVLNIDAGNATGMITANSSNSSPYIAIKVGGSLKGYFQYLSASNEVRLGVFTGTGKCSFFDGSASREIYHEGNQLLQGSIVVNTSSWVASGDPNYSLRKTVSKSGLTLSDRIDLVPQKGTSMTYHLDADVGFTEAISGGFYIYANAVPDGEINYDYVIIKG